MPDKFRAPSNMPPVTQPVAVVALNNYASVSSRTEASQTPRRRIEGLDQSPSPTESVPEEQYYFLFSRDLKSSSFRIVAFTPFNERKGLFLWRPLCFWHGRVRGKTLIYGYQRFRFLSTCGVKCFTSTCGGLYVVVAFPHHTFRSAIVPAFGRALR